MPTHLDYRGYICKKSGRIVYMCAEHFNGGLWLYDGYSYYPFEDFLPASECKAA